MNNKEDLKKQVIVLSAILIFVIIIAIILNFEKSKTITDNNFINNTITTENTNTNIDSKDKILNNLKGLLEEPTEEYEQDETPGITENKIVTQNGETIIVRE